MLWLIGQKDCNWYWLFKADTSLLHLISFILVIGIVFVSSDFFFQF